MAKNLITRHELKNIVSLSVNKKTLEEAKSKLSGLLDNLDIDFSSEDFKQGFKDIVAMFNAAFQQAGKDIDLSSMLPSRENFVKLGQEYRTAFEEALSELSPKGGFRFDFASEDLRQAVGYLEKIAENTTKKVTKNLNKSADEVKAAVYRLSKEEEKLKQIQETLDYQPTQDKSKGKTIVDKNKILLGKLSEQYDTSDNWEDKYHAALRYLKIYEKLQKVNEYDFSDPDDKALTAKYQLFSKQKDHIVTTLTNLLATHASPVISGSESGQAVKVEVKTDGLATEKTLGEIHNLLKGESEQKGNSKTQDKVSAKKEKPSYHKNDGVLTKADENSYELFKKRLINQFNPLNRSRAADIVNSYELDGSDKANQELYLKLYKYKIADLAGTKEDFDISEENISRLLHVYYDLQYRITNALIPEELHDKLYTYQGNLINFLYDKTLFDQDGIFSASSFAENLNINDINEEAFVNTMKELMRVAVLDMSKISSVKDASELYQTADDGIKDQIINISELVRGQSKTESGPQNNADSTDEIAVGVKRLSDFNDALLNVTQRLNGHTDDVSNSEGSSVDHNNIAELINTLNSKTKSTMNEHGTFVNSLTGESGGIVSGIGDAIELTQLDYERAAKKYDARIHTHTAAVAAPSVSGETNDFQTWIDSFGLFKKQIIATKQELLSFDFSSLSLDRLKKIRDEYKDEVSKIDKGSIGTEELQVRMRQALEKIIAPYGSNIMKSYKVPNVISNSFTENDNSVSVLNEISCKVGDKIAQEQTLQEIKNHLINSTTSDKKDDEVPKEDQPQSASQNSDNIKKTKDVINGLTTSIQGLDRLLDDEHYKTTGKKEASEQLRDATSKIKAYRINPDNYSNIAYAYEKYVVAWNKAYKEAERQGVADSTLTSNRTDADMDYERAVETLTSAKDIYLKQIKYNEEKLAMLQKADVDSSVSKTDDTKLPENVTNLSTSVSTANDKFTELNKTLEGFDGAVKTISENLTKKDAPDVESLEDASQENQDSDANKKPTQTVAIDEKGLQRVFNDTTFNVQIAKSEEAEDEDKEDPKLKQIEEKINAVQTTVNKIDTDVNKQPTEPSQLKTLLTNIKASVESIDGKVVDESKKKPHELTPEEKKQEQLKTLNKKAKDAAQLKAKFDISGDLKFHKKAEILAKEIESEWQELGLDGKSLEADKLRKSYDASYKNEIDLSEANKKEKERLKTIKEIERLYEKLGELEAKDPDALKPEDRRYLEDDLRFYREEIEEKEKLIKVNDELRASFDSVQAKSKAEAKKGIVASERRKRNYDLDGLKMDFEELGRLEAQAEATQDPEKFAKASILQKTIDIELRKLDILKDQNDERYKEFLQAKETAKEEQKRIETAKQQKKDLKTQIKDEKKRVRVSDADSADRSANKTLLSLWKIDDESIDVSKIAEVQQLSSSLKDLQRTRNTVNETIASGKEVSDEDIALLRLNTKEVIKNSTAIKELIKNYEYFSDDNSQSLNAVLNPGENVEAKLKAQVMAFTDGKAKIKEYNAETQTLTYTVKTGANEFTTYTAGVRQVDKALRTVQGTTTRTETLFEAITRKTKEVFTYFSGSSVIYKAFNEFQKGIQYVREIDKALVELRKVTDETEASYDKFLKTASKVSDRLGTTITDFTLATSTFAKLGYSIDMAKDMAEAAIVYQNVGDGIESADAAAESIISTMKGFGLEASESMAIVDRFNKIGNEFSITSKGIGDALQRSASALSEGGNSIDESIGLITAANSVVQDPDTVGKI